MQVGFESSTMATYLRNNGRFQRPGVEAFPVEAIKPPVVRPQLVNYSALWMTHRQQRRSTNGKRTSLLTCASWCLGYLPCHNLASRLGCPWKHRWFGLTLLKVLKWTKSAHSTWVISTSTLVQSAGSYRHEKDTNGREIVPCLQCKLPISIRIQHLASLKHAHAAQVWQKATSARWRLGMRKRHPVLHIQSLTTHKAFYLYLLYFIWTYCDLNWGHSRTGKQWLE